MAYSCIIVDDDEVARLTVTSFTKRFPEIYIAGVFENAEDALDFLASNTVDIAFLDIELPGQTGLTLRSKALEIPACVFISSHSESAVETFQIQTLDFILKPFQFDRFEKAIHRVFEFLEIKLKANLFEATIGGDAVYIKSGHDQVKVKMHDILYLEALKNYTMLVTRDKRHCVLSNLGELLQDEKFRSFIRVHRSFAVQKQFIQRIKSQEIELNGGVKVPLGRSYKDLVNNSVCVK